MPQRPHRRSAVTGGFAQRPAGSIDAAELASKLDAARVDVVDLRLELETLRERTTMLAGGLVELDIRRAITALGAAGLALERGRRHTELEP